MTLRISFRFKIFLRSIKNKQARGILKRFIDIQWDKLRIRKHSEYYLQAVSPQQALEELFPNQNLNSNFYLRLEEHIDNFVRNKKAGKIPTKENPYVDIKGLSRNLCRFLLSLCLFSKPKIVVETGVANGFSTSYILLALKETNSGKLISIDGTFLPYHTEEKIGNAIPPELRKLHTLIMGDSAKVLKSLLSGISKIDIFFHDSYHSYNHMTTEFNIAWPFLKKGGFLAADNIEQNDAFIDFSQRINKNPIIITQEDGSFFGIIKKC